MGNYLSSKTGSMNSKSNQKIHNITGIVLAGGKSRRMGKDKAFIELNGKSLLSLAIDLLTPFCDEIIVSANSDIHKNSTYRIIKDEIQDLGPIGGIISALKESTTELNLVIATDTPYINKDLLGFLIANSSTEKISAIVQPNFHIEPLCAIYPTKVSREIEGFIKKGKRKLIDLLIELDYHKVQLSGHESFYNEKVFKNLNTPEDIS